MIFDMTLIIRNFKNLRLDLSQFLRALRADRRQLYSPIYSLRFLFYASPSFPMVDLCR